MQFENTPRDFISDEGLLFGQLHLDEQVTNTIHLAEFTVLNCFSYKD